MTQIAGYIAEQQAPARQGTRPVVQTSHESPWPLPGVHVPAPDLDFLLDLQHLRHLQDEPSLDQRLFQRLPRRTVERCRIGDQGELLVLVIPQRHEPSRLGPRETPPHRHGAFHTVPRSPELAVGAALQGAGIDVVGAYPPNTMFGFPNTNWKAWRAPFGLEVLVSEHFKTTVDAKGFMSVMFQATANRALTVGVRSKYAERNFFMISRNYMSLSQRLGFHFSTLEALVSERSSENYVSYQFKGGAADLERRLSRVRFIAEILEPLGFRVEVTEDHLIARCEGRDEPDMIRQLEILGYLSLHTRQLDMIMGNPAHVEYYRAKYGRDIERLVASAGPERN